MVIVRFQTQPSTTRIVNRDITNIKMPDSISLGSIFVNRKKIKITILNPVRFHRIRANNMKLLLVQLELACLDVVSITKSKGSGIVTECRLPGLGSI